MIDFDDAVRSLFIRTAYYPAVPELFECRMDFVPVMERIAADVDVIDFAAFRHQLPDIFVLVRAAVHIRRARILAASAIFDGGACVHGCRLFNLSGAVLSFFHLSGSLAAFHYVLEQNGCRDRSYSSRYGRYGFCDLISLVVIDVTAELAFLIDIHSDIDDDLSFS